MTDLIYDTETYPKVFTLVMYSTKRETTIVYEISDRRNDFALMCQTLIDVSDRATMVGFNNVGFDYPILHQLLLLYRYNPTPTLERIRVTYMTKVEAIINAGHFQRFDHVVWESDRMIPQMDLFMIHHFDNPAKQTGLKALEFNMRSDSVEDLPFTPDKQDFTSEEIDQLITYNKHDVSETLRFYQESEKEINLRRELTELYKVDFTNFNDTKIGARIMQIRLERALGPNICYDRSSGRKVTRQTPRPHLALKDVIFGYALFDRPEFNAILEFLEQVEIRGQTKELLTKIPFDQLGKVTDYTYKFPRSGKPYKTEKNPVVPDLNVVVDGLKFIFGTGGLHACVDPCTVVASDEWMILDLDVTSYYPSLAIENRLYPAHLTPVFCDEYSTLKEQRVKFAKGSAQNAAFKLGLNGTFGNSNNKYSPFYDPKFTMAITINGQLLLAMLSEMLMEIDRLKIVQVNTDGVTVFARRDTMDQINRVIDRWQKITKLNLESAFYSRMFVRDVNNYIAEYEDGSVKRKGAYEYDQRTWHKDQSAFVVQRAAEANLLHNTPVETFVRNHDDPFDFYIRAKVDRSSRLVLTDGFEEREIQRLSRYYIAKSSDRLVKIMPPLKGKSNERHFAIQDGWNVIINNRAEPKLDSLEHQWYIDQAIKLTEPCNSLTIKSV